MEEYGKEILMLGGTFAGFLAALLTVMEKLLDIQHRLQTKKERKNVPQPERPFWEPSSSATFFPGNRSRARRTSCCTKLA